MKLMKKKKIAKDLPRPIIRLAAWKEMEENPRRNIGEDKEQLNQRLIPVKRMCMRNTRERKNRKNQKRKKKGVRIKALRRWQLHSP